MQHYQLTMVSLQPQLVRYFFRLHIVLLLHKRCVFFVAGAGKLIVSFLRLRLADFLQFLEHGGSSIFAFGLEKLEEA